MRKFKTNFGIICGILMLCMNMVWTSPRAENAINKTVVIPIQLHYKPTQVLKKYMYLDCGIKVIVNRVINKFQNRKFLLLCVIALVFMLFGAFLGLFEEMLTLLPIIAILTLSLGYDSFTGFLVCIVAVGFGFSSALTNPFTVLFASN